MCVGVGRCVAGGPEQGGRPRPGAARLECAAVLNLPNALTLFRIFLVPLLVVVLLTRMPAKEYLALAVFLDEVEVRGLLWSGGGASLRECGGRAVPSERGRWRVFVWVVRRGRSVVADPEVRVWFPSTAVEVVRLRWDCRAGRWAAREARRCERGLV